MKRIVVVAAVLALAGCNMVDHAKVEGSIKDDLVAAKLVVKSVDCPSDRKAKQGDKFTCTVATDHQTLTVDVEQQDDKGTIKWELRGRIYNEKELGDKLEATAGSGVDIQCGEQVTVLTKGDKLSCVTKHPDGKITITMKDDDGNVDLKME